MHTTLFNKIDLVAAPAILLLILLIFVFYRKRQPSSIRKYFFPAFFLRIFGTLSLSAVVEFYYGGGDTYQYYYNAQFLREYFLKNPAGWFRIIFSNPLNARGADLTAYLDHVREFSILTANVFENPQNAATCKIASIFNLICFDSSISIAFFFGALSFLGCWYIFKVFVHIYPGYEKQFAWFCLFLPSLWFWGSGILKDPVCIFGLGLLFYNFFVKESAFLKRLFLMCLGAFLVISIKPYIFYAFSGAAVLGPVVTYFKRVNFLVKGMIIILSAGVLVAAYPLLTSLVNDSFEQIVEESKTYIYEYNRQTTEGNSDIIPEFNPTPAGFAKLGLQGFFTVYLRPFPWELRKVLYIFLILENLLLYYIIFRRMKKGPLNFKKNYKALTNFSMVYFIFMGIIVGVTAFNFGTIARYRVPALPFLFAGIFSMHLAKRYKKTNTALLPGAIPAA